MFRGYREATQLGSREKQWVHTVKLELQVPIRTMFEMKRKAWRF